MNGIELPKQRFNVARIVALGKRSLTALAILSLVAAIPPATVDNDQSATVGEKRLQWQVEPQTALVAQAVKLHYTLDVPAGTVVTPPQFDQVLGAWQVTEVQSQNDLPAPIDPQLRRRWITTVTIESLRAGRLTVPAVKFGCRVAGERTTVSSRPLTIEIQSVLADAESPREIRGLKPPIEVTTPGPSSGPLPIKIMGAVVVLISMLGWVLWRRSRQPTPASSALAKLNALEWPDSTAADPDSTAADPEAYAECMSVLREYLQARLAFPATAQSNQELIDTLAAEPAIYETIHQQVTGFVAESDRVLFQRPASPNQPSRGDGNSPIGRMRQLIQDIDLALTRSEAG